MRAFAAVFSREFREWRALLPASLIAGLIPFAFALIPGFQASPSEVRDAAASFLACVLGGLSALVLGVSVPARDLAEGRMGFYFSRPLSPWAIWSGRLCALTSLSFLSWLLAFLPSTLAGGGLFTVFETGPFHGAFPVDALYGTLLAVSLLLFLILAAQTLSVLLASRSPWLALDAFLLAALTAACTLSFWRLFLAGGDTGFWGASAALTALVFASLLAGQAAALVRGRADLGRVRRSLAWTLWACLIFSAISLEAFSRWYVNPGIGSLRRIQYGISSPAGPWVFIAGHARGRADDFAAHFLLNARTGQFARIPGAAWGLTFSADGMRCAAILSPTMSHFGASEVGVYDLSGAVPRQMDVRVPIDEGWAELALSQDGSRLAVMNENRVALHDLSSRSILFSHRGRGATRLSGRFTGPGQFRLYQWSYDNLARAEGKVLIFDLDISSKSLREVGQMEGASLNFMNVDATCSRILLGRAQGDRWSFLLCDGTTGAELATLAGDASGGKGTFTSDGGIVLAYRKEPGSERRIARFAPDGTLEREVILPTGTKVLLGGECAPGLLAVATYPAHDSSRSAPGVLQTLEVATLTLRPTAMQVEPYGIFGFRFGGASRNVPLPASDGTRLFVDSSGRLSSWDPTTGQSRVILKRG